jgi:hypothetical protein
MQLYMVSVDVSRAFDSIDIDRLLGIVEPAIKSSSYTMIRCGAMRQCDVLVLKEQK